MREGNLDATRHPLDWQNPDFCGAAKVGGNSRACSRCDGCRRCASLCNAFPTLFDLIDEGKTSGRRRQNNDFGKVVDQCYLCDVCHTTKCPYVPPHAWNVRFPHLMLRAKAVQPQGWQGPPRRPDPCPRPTRWASWRESRSWSNWPTARPATAPRAS
ncbi:MAG: hypothetical protein IPI73_00015 [Betaproteobacteria bacterium]|nr:hypothetical protein [Betaproteobacteria bacterium]